MMSNHVAECRKELSEKFLTWLNKNRERIGDKWYEKLLKNFRKEKMDKNTDVFGVSLWMLNMISNLGVMASVGLDGYEIHKIYNNIDRETSEDLLKVISKCFREMQGIEWASG